MECLVGVAGERERRETRRLDVDPKLFMELASKVAGRISQENMRVKQAVVNAPAAAGG